MKIINVEKTKIFPFFKPFSILCAIALLLAFLYFQGYRVNLSGSLPGWIYKIKEASGKTISRGDYVVVNYLSTGNNPAIKTALERGYLSNFPMLKQVGAVSGDLIELRDNRLYVNDADISPMIVLSADSLGNPLYPYPTPVTLEPGQYWLVSNPERGFDSRYFGMIDRSCITHVAHPIF